MLVQGSTSAAVVASVIMAEALALKAAMEAAISHDVKDLVCFSDSKSLISLITGNKSVVALQGILHDLGVLSLSLSSISFKFVNRNGNLVADRLAKEALFLLQNTLFGVVNSI
uniref:RNase H type-1 domain-containing protein n=1 Tax=Brassica oleracea var. oleracea TaxID=109376 RepID=A0A0D3DWH4_BRAOL